MVAAQFPVYQIDFSAEAAGKRVAASKRRIRWRFGYPNQDALNRGLTGTDCRGEEHEIIVIWSVTSGKRQVLLDGKEVHYSASRAGVLDHSWSSKGNHVMKVVCHAAPPMSANPGFRQYDFSIDGQSFFTFPKVYELGIRPGTTPRSTPRASGGDGERSFAAAPRATAQYAAPRNQEEEEAALQAAINASLEESRRHLEKKGPPPQQNGYSNGSTDLFAQPPAPYAPPQQQPYQNYQAPAPPQYYQPQAPPQQQFAALPPSTSYGNQGSYNGNAPPPQQQQQQYKPAPAPYAPGPYAPAPGQYAPASYAPAPYSDPFAPKPATFNDFTSDVMSAYSAQTPKAAGPAPTFDSPAAQSAPPTTTQSNGNPEGLSMNKLAITQEEEDKDPYSAALKKLVNIDRIDMPADGAYKLTMKEEEKKKKPNKSEPIKPVANNMVGSNATLSQISSVKQPKQQKEVMKPNAFSSDAAAAGALVLHSSAVTDGPPPLHTNREKGHVGSGFGIVHQQQQRMQMYQQQQQMMMQQQAMMQQQGYPPQQQGYPPQQQQYQYR